MSKSFRDILNKAPKIKLNKRFAFARPTKSHRDKMKYFRKSNEIIEDFE